MKDEFHLTLYHTKYKLSHYKQINKVNSVQRRQYKTQSLNSCCKVFNFLMKTILMAVFMASTISCTQPIKHPERVSQTIKLTHNIKKLNLIKDRKINISAIVNISKKHRGKYKINLSHDISPNPAGVSFKINYPANGLIGTKPQSFHLNGSVIGHKSGTYTITSTATIQETGASWSEKILVQVIETSASTPLIISRPTAKPVAVALSNNKTTITFRSFVTGTTKPPKVISLHELDKNGKLIFPAITELYDNGKNEDKYAGDFSYTGILNIVPSVEKNITYRLRANHLKKTILSESYTLHITSYPVGIRPSDPSTLVNDPNSNYRLFSNEVIMVVHSNSVDHHRIDEIVTSINAKVVGFSPPHLYLLEIPGDGKATGVQKAIETISNSSEVNYAAPNRETIASAFPIDEPVDNAFPPCTLDPIPDDCQWYLNKINAHQAWQRAAGGTTINVALIEAYGMVDFTHPDLVGQKADVSITNGTDRHATQTAGLIVALTNNASEHGGEAGMAGIAYESKLWPYHANGTADIGDTIPIAISDGAKIINISQQSSNDPALQVKFETYTDRLFVVSVANQIDNGACSTLIYPGAYNDIVGIKEHFLTVGAVDESNNLARWMQSGFNFCSITGNWLDLYAPGKDIYTSSELNVPNQFFKTSGASFSAPITSGAAAVLWAANPTCDASQIHDRIVNTVQTLAGTDITYTCNGGDMWWTRFICCSKFSSI